MNATTGGKAAARVLIVEDDPDVAESFKLLLDIIGTEAEDAADGATALELARRFHPDIAFIDIDLPGMSGDEVAQHLRREHGARLRLIALTGFGQAAVGERVRAAGFERHLIKPIDFELLKQVLDGASAREGDQASP